MLRVENDRVILEGPHGTLDAPDEEVTRKFAMLYEGRCEGLGPTKAAAKYGYTKQRFFQLLHAFRTYGVQGLCSRKRGPKAPSRRTPDTVCQILRHRFLDPEASPDVIAQKLTQTGHPISTRSVAKTLSEWGFQKKTLRATAAGHGRNPTHQTRRPRRTLR